MTQNIRLHHVNLRVRDYDAAKHFYTEGLGFVCFGERMHRDGFMISMLKLPGGGILELVGGAGEPLPPDFEHREGSLVHLAFQVDDLESALSRLLACGGTQRGPVRDKEQPFPMRVAVVTGTAGEIVELIRISGTAERG